MILANHHLKSEKESKLRHEENFPLSGNILCNYLKECWKNGWLDEPELFTQSLGNRFNTRKTLIKMKNGLSPKK